MVEYYQKLTTREAFGRIATERSSDIWVHSRPNTNELALLVSTYGLDRNIVQDVCDERELPRAEYSDGNLYVFTRTVESHRAAESRTRTLLSVVTPSVFMTIAPHSSFKPEAVPEGLVRTTTHPQELLVATLITIIYGYEEHVQRTGEVINQMRRRLQTREINNDDFVTFVTIEDDLNEYHTNLNSLLSVLRRLADNRHKTFSAKSIEAIDDMILHIEQLVVSVASHRQSTNSIQSVYGTIANNHLNQRMKILTVFTVLLTMPNVFYGMYGMNVPLPFQDELWMYPAIVVFTFGLIVLILLLAKRFKLL